MLTRCVQPPFGHVLSLVLLSCRIFRFRYPRRPSEINSTIQTQDHRTNHDRHVIGSHRGALDRWLCGRSLAVSARSPLRVALEVDGSASAKGNAEQYLQMFDQWLVQRQGQSIALQASVMTADTDASACPVAEAEITIKPDEPSPEREWQRQARALLAEAKPVIDCASQLGSRGSELTAFEHARSFGATDLVLLSDAMTNRGTVFKADRLGDSKYVREVVDSIAPNDALNGVSVSVLELVRHQRFVQRSAGWPAPGVVTNHRTVRRHSQRMENTVRKMATRFPALTRRDQLKAWFCGFVDARHGIPAGEPTTGQDTPGSVTIAKRWEPLLDKISGQFHRIEAGYAVALLAGADAPTKALVPDVPAEGRAAGPDARSIRRAAERDAANASATNAAGDAARLAAIQAADQLLAEWNAFRLTHWL